MASELQSIRESVHGCLKLNPDDLLAIDYLLALSITNTRGTDPEPTWGFLIGPPGSSKTELLRTLAGWTHTISVDELSLNSLASGFEDEEGKNPSLLPMLDGKVLIIKDFTTLIQSPPIVRNKIMGSLRSAFDDSYGKADGRTGLKTYRCKFGIIAAVTGVVDRFLQEDQQLGQRFVGLRIARTRATEAERRNALLHVIAATHNKTAWRAAIRAATQANLDNIRTRVLKGPLPDPPEGFVQRLVDLADITVRVRTMPSKEGNPSDGEFAGRLVQQLKNLAECRAIADDRDHIDGTDYAFVLRVAQDTLPLSSRRLLWAFCRQADADSPVLTADRISAWTGDPLDHVYSTLHQYRFLGIADFDGKHSWTLTREIMAQLRRTGLGLGEIH